MFCKWIEFTKRGYRHFLYKGKYVNMSISHVNRVALAFREGTAKLVFCLSDSNSSKH